MGKQLTAYFISLVQDACLKAFWKKQALRSFLRHNHINPNLVAPLNEGATKAEVLANIFERLSQAQDSKHQAVVLAIARELVAMESFPDLEGWEDSSAKIDAAKQAVTKLRLEYQKLESYFIDTGDVQKRKVAKQQREKVFLYEQQMKKFAERLADLSKHAGEQKAGYDFENWIYEFSSFNDLQARRPYKDKHGRQIDGALQIDADSMIVEAKCTACRISVEDIDSFRAKIATKADNTLGLMISMSGYTSQAIEAASGERSPLLLIDGAHLFNLVMTRQMTFKELICRVKRNAAQTGCAYLPLADF